MLVTVKLHGIFRIDRFKEKKVEYPSGTKVMDVVEQLKLPCRLLGIVLVNDIHSTIDSQLKNGDILVLLPLLDGG